MIDENVARRLLEKYFDGMTTLEEEALLAGYLTSGNLPADLEYARAIFAGLTAVRSATADGVRCQMPPVGERMESSQKRGPGRTETGRRRRMTLRTVWLGGIAAVAAVVMASVAYMESVRPRPQIYCYVDGKPVTDPEIAARQVLMAQRIMEAGINALESGIETVERTGRSLRNIGAEADSACADDDCGGAEE